MFIQILGTGCAKCEKLAQIAEEAANQTLQNYQIEKVTQIERILEMGVISTPALAVDGKVKFSGKIPTIEEMRKILENANSAKGANP